MASFSEAFYLTLANEGGYVNHALDKGGPTNMGITMRTLKAYRKKEVTPSDIHALSVVEAQAIYKELYWGAIYGHAIAAQTLANQMFDLSVLFGPRHPIRWLQALLSCDVDGIMGPKTLDHLRIFLDTNLLHQGLEKKACAYIDAIVARTPSQRVFQKGWVERITRMSEPSKKRPALIA